MKKASELLVKIESIIHNKVLKIADHIYDSYIECSVCSRRIVINQKEIDMLMDKHNINITLEEFCLKIVDVFKQNEYKAVYGLLEKTIVIEW